MSAIQKFIEKVEHALSDFMALEPETRDPALVRLRRDEETLLEELKSIRTVKAGHNVFTCLSAAGAAAGLAAGSFVSWSVPVVGAITIFSAAALYNAFRAHRVRQRLDHLKDRQDRLFLAMQHRLDRRSRLESTERSEALVLGLDGLDTRLAGKGRAVQKTRTLIRTHVKRFKRELLVPFLDERDRSARYLLDQDRDGLAEEIDEAEERLGQKEAELDIEAGDILERNIAAKRDTLLRVDEAEHRLATMDLKIEALESQLARLEAVISSGHPDELQDIDRLFVEMEEILTPIPVDPLLGAAEVRPLPSA